MADRRCVVVDIGCSDEGVAPKPVTVQSRFSNESASFLRQSPNHSLYGSQILMSTKGSEPQFDTIDRYQCLEGVGEELVSLSHIPQVQRQGGGRVVSL